MQYAVRSVHVEATIKDMGLILPAPGSPKGTYRTVIQTGNYLYLAGIVVYYIALLNCCTAYSEK